jgi:hypothetical protein
MKEKSKQYNSCLFKLKDGKVFDPYQIIYLVVIIIMGVIGSIFGKKNV